MNKENLNRFFIVVLFLVLAYLSFMILQGFLMSIFIGAIVAYIVFPVYKKLEGATGSGKASALLLSIAAVSVLIILLGLIILPLVGEFEKFYSIYASSFPQKLEELGKCSSELDDYKCRIYSYLTANVDETTLQDAAVSIAKPASEYVINSIMDFIKNLPNLLIQFTIILFSTFYFLNSGASAVRKSLKALPLKETQKTKIKHRIKDVLNAVIYGNLMTSFIEGVIVAILFYLLGIDLAVIAGILIMVFALLPPLGAMIVWLPAVIILVLMKEYVKAILLFAACFAILGYIDNIARPAIISKRVRLSFLWVLLGVFGGLSTFGFIGILAGPLILSLFVTVLDLASEDLIEAQNNEDINHKT
ncbi:MAG: AI-2E family transporter [Candidatus Altiarchaeia archaeon]